MNCPECGSDVGPIKEAKDRDACQLCGGFRGGVPGNENVIDGVTVCDYCSATIFKYKKLLVAPAKETP